MPRDAGVLGCTRGVWCMAASEVLTDRRAWKLVSSRSTDMLASAQTGTLSPVRCPKAGSVKKK